MALVKPLSGVQTMIFAKSIMAGPIFVDFFVDNIVINVKSHEPVGHKKQKHVTLGFRVCQTRISSRWNVKTYRSYAI
jgi:hypothetical protein